MRSAPWRSSTETILTVLPSALAAAFAIATVCVRETSGGTTYRVGHGIVVWHPAPARGGFLPWAFRVTTPAAGPDAGAPYVVLERAGPGAGVDVLAEAALPAGATGVPVHLDFEPRRVVLRVGRDVAGATPVDAAYPLPLCCGRAHLVASPGVLPQDSAGAIVLQYAISEHLAASDSGSFETARRLEGATYLRLRFGVRP
jgi:hypothetical protein